MRLPKLDCLDAESCRLWLYKGFDFIRVACILFTKLPVQVGDWPCVEVAPSVMMRKM